jgi:hypothetical protein
LVLEIKPTPKPPTQGKDTPHGRSYDDRAGHARGDHEGLLSMVFKLAQAAERKWRKLNGHQLLGDIIRGIQFKDGIKVAA